MTDTSTSRCMNLQVTIYVSTELSALILLSIRFLLNRPFQKTSGNLNLVVGLARASLKIVFRGAPGKNMKNPWGPFESSTLSKRMQKIFVCNLKILQYTIVCYLLYIYILYIYMEIYNHYLTCHHPTPHGFPNLSTFLQNGCFLATFAAVPPVGSTDDNRFLIIPPLKLSAGSCTAVWTIL